MPNRPLRIFRLVCLSALASFSLQVDAAVFAVVDVQINGETQLGNSFDVYSDDTISLDASASYSDTPIAANSLSYQWSVDSYYSLGSGPSISFSGSDFGAGNHQIVLRLDDPSPRASGPGSYDAATFSFLFYGSPRPSPVPIPAAAWLFGSAVFGLGALKRRKGQSKKSPLKRAF